MKKLPEKIDVDGTIPENHAVMLLIFKHKINDLISYLTPDSLAEKGECCEKPYLNWGGNGHLTCSNCGTEKTDNSTPTEVGVWEEEFDREYTKLNGTNSERGGEIIKSLVKKTLSHQLEEFAGDLKIVLMYLQDNSVDMRKSAERKLKEIITQSPSKRK